MAQLLRNNCAAWATTVVILKNLSLASCLTEIPMEQSS